MKTHLLEKIDTCHNNPEKSSATKINKHTTSRYSLFTHCSFDVTKNRHGYQRIHRYAPANNKYMKNYSKNKESLYLMYLDTHHSYECPISQKLPVNSFK